MFTSAYTDAAAAAYNDATAAGLTNPYSAALTALTGTYGLTAAAARRLLKAARRAGLLQPAAARPDFTLEYSTYDPNDRD